MITVCALMHVGAVWVGASTLAMLLHCLVLQEFLKQHIAQEIRLRNAGTTAPSNHRTQFKNSQLPAPWGSAVSTL
jgi:hypothetical protein